MSFQVTVILWLKLWNVCPMPVNREGVEVQEVQHTHVEASLLYMYIYIYIYLYHMQKVFFFGKLDFSRTCIWIEGCVQIC